MSTLSDLRKAMNMDTPQVHLPKPIANLRTPLNAGGELFAEALEKYIRGLEARLEEDESLLIVNRQGERPMRVARVAYPSGRTLVLIGVDADGNEMHVFSHVSAVQLGIKIVPKEPSEQRAKIGFHNLMDDQGE